MTIRYTYGTIRHAYDHTGNIVWYTRFSPYAIRHTSYGPYGNRMNHTEIAYGPYGMRMDHTHTTYRCNVQTFIVAVWSIRRAYAHTLNTYKYRDQTFFVGVWSIRIAYGVWSVRVWSIRCAYDHTLFTYEQRFKTYFVGVWTIRIAYDHTYDQTNIEIKLILLMYGPYA